MSVACLMMAASCEKDGNGDSQTPEVPVITVAEGIKTAGSDLILRADGIDADAKFYLQSGENRIDIEAEVSASGATVKLPYNLGEYTLYVEQEGASYEAGKITIAVTDVVLPADAVSSGEEIVIKGNGFASDAVIVIGGKDADSSAVPTEVTLTVPELEAGTYTVSVKQVGTEQSLGKLIVAVKTVRTKIGIQMDMMGDGTLMEIYSCTAGYNDNDEPVSLAVYNSQLEEYGNYSYLITKKENVYTFEGDMVSWSFTIEDGRVKTFTYDGEDYDWVYNEDGQLTSFYVDAEGAYKIAYADGNYKQSVPGNEQVTKSDEIDVTLVSEKWMEIDMNSEIYYAAVLFGWAGKPSKNYPSEIEFGPIEYTFDNGYVTSAETEMSAIICEYK